MASGAAKSVEHVLAAFSLLGLEPLADEAAIKRAYRDASRKTHPDKNPDDPRANEKFDAVNKAYELIMDGALRAEFAQKLAAREAAKARIAEMDVERQRKRNALEAREKAAATAGKGPASSAAGSAATSAASTASSAAAAEKLARLRQEGRDMMFAEGSDGDVSRQREREAAAERLFRAAAAGFGSRGPVAASSSSAAARAAAPAAAAAEPAFNLEATVKLKWTADLAASAGLDELDGQRTFSEDQLEAAVQSSGTVLAVLSRKPLSACVVMESLAAARALLASPPPGFRAAPVLASSAAAFADDDSRGAGASAASADGAFAGTGFKRPRSAVPGLDGSFPGASYAATAAAGVRDGRAATAAAGSLQPGVWAADGLLQPTAAQTAAFAAEEAAVLAKLHALAGGV